MARSQPPVPERPSGATGDPVPPTRPGDPGGMQDPEIGETYLRHLAHELRASLNTVVGWVELMRARQYAPDTAQQAAEIISRHSQQQAWLIDCVIEAWRVSAGRLVLARSAMDPRALVRGAADTVTRAATARGVRVEVRETPARWRLDGDANRLRLLLVSLLMNAIHFAPAGSAILIAIEEAGDGLAIRISQLPAEQQAVLPERREQFGAGLGLARALARAHGGELSTGVESGAPLFDVALPAVGLAQAEAARGDQRLRGLRVLVVEDDDDVRGVVGTLLAGHGAVPHLVRSAEDALDLLLSEPIDVLLSDLELPSRGGLELLQTIRRLPSPQGDLPAVAFTALTGESNEQRARSAGFSRYLTKPLDVEALVTALTGLIPLR